MIKKRSIVISLESWLADECESIAERRGIPIDLVVENLLRNELCAMVRSDYIRRKGRHDEKNFGRDFKG